MSDVLIKGMEMPKNCFDCPFLKDDFCIVLGYEMRNDQILMGCGSCPLVEVRPHGRLIDADLFKGNAIRVYTQEGKEYIPADYIDIVPTVLEASNGSDN